MAKKPKKVSVHYVDNKKFLQAMKDWKEQCAEAEEAGDETPRISNYIGECFLKIENCLQYIHNFNPEKSNNPFAYFTQIIYYAFIRRIQKEKKQAHVKHQLISKQEYIPFVTNPYDTTPYQVSGFDVNIMVPDEAVYKPKKKESKDKISGLENFMGLDD